MSKRGRPQRIFSDNETAQMNVLFSSILTGSIDINAALKQYNSSFSSAKLQKKSFERQYDHWLMGKFTKKHLLK
jgi:hypothetical protein